MDCIIGQFRNWISPTWRIDSNLNSVGIDLNRSNWNPDFLDFLKRDSSRIGLNRNQIFYFFKYWFWIGFLRISSHWSSMPSRVYESLLGILLIVYESYYLVVQHMCIPTCIASYHNEYNPDSRVGVQRHRGYNGMTLGYFSLCGIDLYMSPL